MFGSSGFFQGIEFDVGFPIVQPLVQGVTLNNARSWSLDTDYGSGYSICVYGTPFIDGTPFANGHYSGLVAQKRVFNSSSTDVISQRYFSTTRDTNNRTTWDLPGWQLGYSISMYNNTSNLANGFTTNLIAGAPGDSGVGAVKLLTGNRTSSGLYDTVNAGSLDPNINNPGDRFGSSIKARYITSLGGMVTLIGAEGADNGRGLVKVISPGNNLILNYPGPSSDTNPQWGNSFHFETRGKWLFITAPGSDNGEGSVWIYQITNDIRNPLSLWGSVKSPSPQAGARFGSCVTANTLETVFAVGEPGWNGGQGRAHVFLLNPNPVFSYTVTSNAPLAYSNVSKDAIQPFNLKGEDFTPRFGFSVYLDYFGGRLLISKPGFPHGQRFLGLVEQYQNNGDSADYLGYLTQANTTSGNTQWGFGFNMAKARQSFRSVNNLGVLISSVVVQPDNTNTVYNGMHGALRNFTSLTFFA